MLVSDDRCLGPNFDEVLDDLTVRDAQVVLLKVRAEQARCLLDSARCLPRLRYS